MYAWIRQIICSNRIYILIIIIYIKNVLILTEIENDVIRDNTIWPAVIFAAERNLKLIERTRILVVSIITRNGFNHIGALSGKRWPIIFLGKYINLLNTNISHIGRLSDNIIIIWLEVLKI